MGYLTEENGVVLVKNGTAYDIFDENRKFNCDGCGVCQKFCPVSAIHIELVKV
jgi:ferredoxin